MKISTLVPIWLLISHVCCSPGDQLEEFQNCVKKCDYLMCDKQHRYEFTRKELRLLTRQQREYELFDIHSPNLWLRILGWTCLNDCDYQCQRIITKHREQNQEEIYQFHGKWPFVRVLGIQELFSTLFSIANFIPHYFGFVKLRAQMQKTSSVELNNLYTNYLYILVVTMGAWVFSTIFHLKDTWNREKMDYFFAGGAVLTGFHAIGARVFQLHLTRNSLKRAGFTLVCVLLYIYHFTRLNLDWSYTYNMQANVVIGLLQNVLYIYHAITTYLDVIPTRSQPLRYVTNPDYNWCLTPIALVLTVCFGMSFELFDFPPVWDLIDAHAIWHFVTIWPLFFWYDYLIADVEMLNDLKYD